jgi:hypothetical protein
MLDNVEVIDKITYTDRLEALRAEELRQLVVNRIITE